MSGGIGETNIDKSRIEAHGVFVCVSMVVAVSNARHCCVSQSAFNFRPSCIGRPAIGLEYPPHIPRSMIITRFTTQTGQART